MSELDQEKVWRGIRSAIKTLQRAQALERQIETERIAGEWRASRLGGWSPSSAGVSRDPLEHKIESIIEQLQDLL